MSNLRWLRQDGMKRSVLIAITILGIGALSVRGAPPVHADFGQCNPNYSCVDFPVWGGGPNGVVWCNTRFTQTTKNGWMQRCLHSKQLVLPTKDQKYAIFDMYVTSAPDVPDQVYSDWWDQRDTSVNGDRTTQETRLWSNNRTSGCQYTSCDQENFSPLEPGPQCNQSGSGRTISVSATIQNINVSFSESDPLYDACLDIPGSDVYSQYYNWTMMNQGADGDKFTTDFSFAQWAPYGYGGNTIKIGLSAKAVYWVVANAPGCINGCDFSVYSGDWTDNYSYSA